MNIRRKRKKYLYSNFTQRLINISAVKVLLHQKCVIDMSSNKVFIDESSINSINFSYYFIGT